MNVVASKPSVTRALVASFSITGMKRKFTVSFHTWNVVTKKS
jgi:hypothetical protein